MKENDRDLLGLPKRNREKKIFINNTQKDIPEITKRNNDWEKENWDEIIREDDSEKNTQSNFLFGDTWLYDNQRDKKVNINIEYNKDDILYIVQLTNDKYSTQSPVIAGPFVGEKYYFFNIRYVSENCDDLTLTRYSIKKSGQVVYITRYESCDLTFPNHLYCHSEDNFIINGHKKKSKLFKWNVEVVTYKADNIDDLIFAELDVLLVDIQIKRRLNHYDYWIKNIDKVQKDKIYLNNLEKRIIKLKSYINANIFIGILKHAPIFLINNHEEFKTCNYHQVSFTDNHLLFLVEYCTKYLQNDIWNLVISFLIFTFEELLELFLA